MSEHSPVIVASLAVLLVVAGCDGSRPADTASVAVSATIIELGEGFVGDTRSGRFVVHNATGRQAVLTDFTKSCGCQRLIAGADPVMKGSRFQLAAGDRLEFRAEMRLKNGESTGKIRWIDAASGDGFEVRTTGRGVPSHVVEPAEVHLGKLTIGEPVPFEVRVQARADVPIDVADATGELDIQIVGERELLVRGTAVARAEGPFFRAYELAVRGSNRAVEFRVFGTVPETVSVPRVLSFGLKSTTASAAKEMEVTTQDPGCRVARAWVEDCQLPDECVRVSHDSNHVRLTIESGHGSGAFSGTLVVALNTGAEIRRTRFFGYAR